MVGLLDFVQSPEGRGLLSAAFGGLAAARRGQPLNTLGAAGLSGLNGYQGAQQFQSDQALRQQQAAAMQTSNALHKLQADKLTRDMTKQDKIEDLATQFYVPGQTAGQAALEQGAQAGDVGPTLSNAARIGTTAQARPGGFDMPGYLDAVSRVDPMMGVKMVSDLRKANQVTLKDGEQVFDTSGRLLYGNDPKLNLTYHPGDGYRPDVAFNTRTGEVMPIGGQRQAPQMGGFPPPAQMPSPQAAGAAPGAPQAPAVRAPWDGMPPKEADQFRKQVYDLETKKLDDLRAEVAKGRSVMADLERFKQLNLNTGTGDPIRDRLFGFMPTMDSDKLEMEAISSRLAPAVRAPGSGASSDRDVSLFLASLPGIDKPGNVNRDIREQFGSNLSRAEQRLAAAERYLTENGHLNGFDEAWRGGRQPQNAAPKPAAPMPPPPKPMEVRDGYIFLGGEPGDRSRWRKAQ